MSEGRKEGLILQGRELWKVQIRERTSQVVVGEGQRSHILIEGVTDDTKPESSTRVRCNVPVGVVEPEGAPSRLVKSE